MRLRPFRAAGTVAAATAAGSPAAGARPAMGAARRPGRARPCRIALVPVAPPGLGAASRRERIGIPRGGSEEDLSHQRVFSPPGGTCRSGRGHAPLRGAATRAPLINSCILRRRPSEIYPWPRPSKKSVRHSQSKSSPVSRRAVRRSPSVRRHAECRARVPRRESEVRQLQVLSPAAPRPGPPRRGRGAALLCVHGATPAPRRCGSASLELRAAAPESCCRYTGAPGRRGATVHGVRRQVEGVTVS